MNKTEENYIDHEVKIRLSEALNGERYKSIQQTFKSIDEKFDKIDQKMDSHFKWMLGTMITLFGGIILHLAKLI